MARSWVLVFLVGAVPLTASGQERVVLTGRVRSAATGLAVPGALVALDAGRRTLADADGWFVLEDLVAGPYRIAAVGPGCHVSLGEVDVPESGGAALDLSVEFPPGSDPTVDGWDRERRRAAAAVRVMEAEEIRRRGFRSVTDAVRAMVPSMVGQESSGAGGRQEVRGRSRNTVTGSTEPLVVVDGVRITRRTADALALIDPASVRRLELIPGTAGAWGWGIEAVNGVILVETMRSADHDARTPPERCGFEFPR